MSKCEFDIWVGGSCISLVDRTLSAEQRDVIFGIQRVAEIFANARAGRFSDGNFWEKNYIKKQHELGWLLLEVDSKNNQRTCVKSFQSWRYLSEFFIPHIPEELRVEAMKQLEAFFTLPTTHPLLKGFLKQAVVCRTGSSDFDSLAVEFRVITRSMRLYSARLYMHTTEHVQNDWHTQLFAPSGLKSECLAFGADSLHQQVVDEVKSDLIGWMKKSQANHFKKID